MTPTRALTLSVLVAVSMTRICSGQQTSTSTAANTSTTKGTAIGQTINAAITAALPAVFAIENVIATIFKKPAGSVPPSATTKVSAQTVTDAVKKSADPTVLASAAQAQLTALQGAITEIATVNELAQNAQIAGTGLTASRALLAVSNWDAFKQQWAVAKTNLAKVTATDPSKLGKITDENVLLAWDTVNRQYAQWISDVDNYSAQKNLTLTLSSFDQLSGAIASLAQIPSVELKLISDQLQTVKAQPSDGTKAPPRPSTTQGPLAGFLTQTIPQAR
jgi:hypothetical protein